MARVEGQQVQVGDWVSFKSDVEQSGKIDAIISGNRLVLKPGANGFQGAYLEGLETTIVRAEDCWLD